MRVRFWATMRSPARSITALTAPVRFRSVASGLMMENVRSAMEHPRMRRKDGLYSRHPAPPQAAFRRCEKILWGDGRLSIGRLGSEHLDQEAPHGICRDAHIAC